MGNLISLADYAKKNGKAVITVRDMASRGRFVTAQKIARNWVIDADEPYPSDARIRTGDYKDWRKLKNGGGNTMYKVIISSNSSHEREYEQESRSAMVAAKAFGRCEGGEVVSVYAKSGKEISRVCWSPEDGGRYYRATI